MVRLRLKRMGRRHRPFYRLNAVDKRTQRDGKVLEQLGWYDPMSKDETKQCHLNTERIKFWLEQGAMPSDTVSDLLAQHDVIDAGEWETKRMKRIAKRKATVVEAKIVTDAAAKVEAEAKAAEAAKAEAEAAAAAKAEAEAKAKADAEAKEAETAAAATASEGEESSEG
jgi:small subunit ribosomal protein S16